MMRIWVCLFMTAACRSTISERPTAPRVPAPAIERLASDAWIPLSNAIIATPRVVRRLASSAGEIVQRDRGRRRLLVDGDVAVLRFGDTVLYGTAAEVKSASIFLARGGARRFEGLRWALGDLGFVPSDTSDGVLGGRGEDTTRLATRAKLVWLGQQAGVRVGVAEDGWLIECWDCHAPAIIGGLAALGASVTVPEVPASAARPSVTAAPRCSGVAIRREPSTGD